MFLLIQSSAFKFFIFIHFNTSHVSINQSRNGFKGNKRTISIHPMFLLITLYDKTGKKVIKFQYIPCFY